MKESKKKENAPKEYNKFNTFTLIYDEFAIEHVVNAIQESYSQAGVYDRDVEK